MSYYTYLLSNIFLFSYVAIVLIFFFISIIFCTNSNSDSVSSHSSSKLLAVQKTAKRQRYPNVPHQRCQPASPHRRGSAAASAQRLHGGTQPGDGQPRRSHERPERDHRQRIRVLKDESLILRVRCEFYKLISFKNEEQFSLRNCETLKACKLKCWKTYCFFKYDRVL